jgi:predicted O-methyltransferase YrrM
MKRTIKKVARRCLSDRMVGSIDYFRFPERRLAWGGPFNGQSNRVQIFKEIMARSRPSAIIETGTYVGTTTELMAETGLPVYSIEGHPRNYGFARARLRRKRNVSLRLGDSRTELLALFGGPLRSMKDKTIFVYLDAHWNADLPLGEELEIVFRNCQAAVVMVDDFQVPGDAGYGYDNYGSGKALTGSYIAPAIVSFGLVPLYPALPSADETGMRRGCVVLVQSARYAASLLETGLFCKA